MFMLPAYAFAQLVLLPPIEEDMPITYDADMQILMCKDLMSIKSTNSYEQKLKFSLYLMEDTPFTLQPMAVSYRKDAYDSMRAHLLKMFDNDPDIVRSAQDPAGLKWDLPGHKAKAWSVWVRVLNSEKKRTEKDLCALKLYQAKRKELENSPLEFIDAYNSLLAEYEELATRCKKPDITGWTQDKAAIEYAKCLSDDKQRDNYNKKNREMKLYRSLRKSYLPILEKMGLAGKLSVPIEERLNKEKANLN